MSNKEDEKIFRLPVHPAAEIFPMMEDEELNELAEDIRTNGQIHPLVTKDGQLIDGRNRREACKRAGVIPTTIELDGQDPAAYILGSNIRRRHMTKGQQAMATAMIFPDPEKRGRGNKKSLLSKEFSQARISQARTVLKYTPEDAKNVLAGTVQLNEAYNEAQLVKSRN